MLAGVVHSQSPSDGVQVRPGDGQQLLRLKLGFSDVGVLSSRSVMLPELCHLLGVGLVNAGLEEFRRLAVEDDALHKASAANRKKTFNFLRRLYALDLRVPLFREAFRLQKLFPADLRALMGLLAFAREPLLRACADRVMRTPVGKGPMEKLVRQYESLGIKVIGWLCGKPVWGKRGIAVAWMRNLPVSLYVGSVFDNSAAVLKPKNEAHLPAIYAYVTSSRNAEDVREINQKVQVATTTLAKVPFDLEYWQQVATETYPNGLPRPYSDDPTQWIFHGHPRRAIDPLQVAVARLLGYRWPAERDEKMELSDEAHAWVSRYAELDPLCDDDGIVCLPAVRGEAVAADRLRALLARAFGTDWSAAREAALLREAGCDGLPLAQWLRDKFFAQHVARFQKRPFIWHVWDGHKEGFSALLNVHTLTRTKLQTLIHTYLGDWITQQKRALDAADVTSSGDATLRLAHAQALNAKREAILEGEAPYDIFVRWKPAHLQPIGRSPTSTTACA